MQLFSVLISSITNIFLCVFSEMESEASEVQALNDIQKVSKITSHVTSRTYSEVLLLSPPKTFARQPARYVFFANRI